jgi:hypothetical protein
MVLFGVSFCLFGLFQDEDVSQLGCDFGHVAVVAPVDFGFSTRGRHVVDHLFDFVRLMVL